MKVEPEKAIQGALSSFPKVAGDACVAFPVESISAGLAAGNSIFQLLKVLFILVSRAIIAPFEFLMRRRIGERYFSIPVFITCGVIDFGASATRLITPAVAMLHFFSFALAAGLVSRRCYKRDRKGEYWHSYSEGEPIFKVTSIDRRLDEDYFTWSFSLLVIEPVLLLACGFILNLGGLNSLMQGFVQFLYEAEWRFIAGFFSDYLRFSHSAAQVLFTAAVATFAYQYYCHKYRRGLILDQQDAQAELEAQSLAYNRDNTSGIHYHKGVAYRSKVKQCIWRE